MFKNLEIPQEFSLVKLEAHFQELVQRYMHYLNYSEASATVQAYDVIENIISYQIYNNEQQYFLKRK